MWLFEISSVWRLGEGKTLVRQVDKVLGVTHLEGVPDVTPDPSEDVPKTLALNLFDIDPSTKLERPVRVDLNLDQLEDTEE